jgi:ATP-binding cassette subfamily C protein CydD/ATP-binding cassette subfamily C protein CydCD
LLVVDGALGLAGAALLIVQATLLARILADGFAGASLDDVRTELIALVAVFAGRGVLAWGFEVAGRVAATSVLSQLRLEIVERRLREQPAALDGTESAEFAGAAVHGLQPLEAYFGRFLPQLVLAAVVPVAVIAWVVPLDPLSALLMTITLPLVPVFMVLIGRFTARETRARWQALALLSNHFLDVVRGLPTLRAFNRERAQLESLRETTEQYRRATMRTLRVSFLSGSVLELAATLGVALVAVTVGVRLVDGGIGLEAALTVLILAPELYLPLRNLGTQFHASADGLAVAQRLLELSEGGGPVRRPAAVAPSNARASVRLERVSYSYPLRKGAVLQAVDLELEPGETVALVGPSGSGKTTVAMLLLGLVAPTSGRVFAPGRAAWVPQSPTIFRGTIAENVRLGAPAAPHERVRRALEDAGADFVHELPEGLATVVGDGGRVLSAGQCQRIALARAFVCDARFVVLDEPTANLDPANVRAVADAISRLAVSRSLLLITHSEELAQEADRIVRLQSGRIVPDTPRAPNREAVVA